MRRPRPSAASGSSRGARADSTSRLDQANVSTVSAVVDANTSDGVRPVTVNKLRRIGFAALAFPVHFGRVRPYAGLGISVDAVGSAVPQLGAKENSVDDAVSQRIDDNRSQAGLLGMAGLQVQFERLAIFGQASVVGATSTLPAWQQRAWFLRGRRSLQHRQLALAVIASQGARDTNRLSRTK